MSYVLLSSVIQKGKKTFSILGIEMPSAFDTIDKEKILKMIEVMLDEAEMNMVKTLIEKTIVTIEFKSSKKVITTEICSLQGDSMSPYNS